MSYVWTQEGFEPATFRSTRDERGQMKQQSIDDYLDEDERAERGKSTIQVQVHNVLVEMCVCVCVCVIMYTCIFVCACVPSTIQVLCVCQVLCACQESTLLFVLYNCTALPRAATLLSSGQGSEASLKDHLSLSAPYALG